MHTVINVDEVVPKMVWFTSAATHDHVLLDKLKMDENTIYVFDKGYNDYKAFEKFCLNKTSFITKIKDNTISRKSGKRLAKRTIQIRIDGFILRGLTFEIQENRKFKRLNICSLKIRKNYFVFLSDNSENIYIY